MSELTGLLLLLAGLGLLTATGYLVACCLRVRSPVEFALAAYVVGWSWLVAAALLLSPAEALTRTTLLGALATGAGVACVAWLATGRPAAPDFRPSLALVRDALRNPSVLVLAVAVALGALYVTALAFFTPMNDWDALSYHLARAALWKQEHGLGYLDVPHDSRLNHNPPNAEIGQLATMLLAGSDRYVALPQLASYAILCLAVAGLARRIGLEAREAVFAALVFATLPLLVLQATGALNDLVVASFLAAAVVFVLGSTRGALVLLALSIGLAVGTKFSALLALPTFALVAAVGTRPRRWPAVALASAAGLLLGSPWYLLNVSEADALDGGAAEETDQRADAPGALTLITALRLGLGFVDMSGAPWHASALFLVGAAVLAALGLLRWRRGPASGRATLAAAALAGAVVALPLVFAALKRPVFKAGLVLDVPRAALDELSWAINTKAEPTLAWYGPLSGLLLVVGTVAALLLWRRGKSPFLAVALAVAPWPLVLTLVLTITWDPWRGRFLLFGVVLAAATWGVVLRSRVLAPAVASIGAIAVFLALANYEGKPSGLGSEATIWGNARWEAQTRLSGPREVHRFVHERVPEDARLALSLPGNHHVHPYFGPRVSRHVSLVASDGGSPPAESQWLVRAPETGVRRCDDAWEPAFVHQGWSVERRVAPDACLSRSPS